LETFRPVIRPIGRVSDNMLGWMQFQVYSLENIQLMGDWDM